MANYSIGVDLGGTNLRVAAVDEKGQLIERLNLETKVALGRDRVVRDMCGGIQGIAAKHKDAGKLLGIGIGVPGIIDLETGMVRESPNLPDWGDYPVRTEIEQQLKAPVILENDANSAAVGERWLGAAKNYQDVAMLTLGTGVGGGLLLGGSVWHGMNGMAAEFGHFTVEPDGALCGCGNRGCLEAYASATAVVRMAREAGVKGSAAHEEHEFTAKSVYELATHGDETARQVMERLGRALGIVLSGLVNALNLPLYVIGGGVSNAWDIFAPTMFKELQERSMVYAATDPAPAKDPIGASKYVCARGARRTIIARALLGGDAGLFGAARLAMLRGRGTI